MKYFNPVVVTGLFGVSVWTKNPAFAACAVVVCGFIALQAAYERYQDAHKSSNVELVLKQVLEENAKMKVLLDQSQSDLGSVRFAVSQMQEYMGAPR